MPTPRAVTFDFHDTLASCERWFELEVRLLPAEVLARLPDSAIDGGPRPDADGVTATYRSLRTEIIGHGNELDALACVRETLARHGVTTDRALTATLIDDLMREALSDAAPLAGAVETVRWLHSHGFALGVVSSAVHHRFLTWVLDSFGILGDFAAVVTSASSGFYKSRPEIYRHALAQLGAEPGRACHVGDSPRWDHLTAKSVGMRTVLVRPDQPAMDDGDPEPDLRLTSLLDAGPAIASLLSLGATSPASD